MRLRLALIALVVSVAAVSAAKPPFLKVFLSTYKINPNGKIAKAKCLNCHQPPAPPVRNAYGKAVQAAMAAAKSRMVTAEILKSVEKKDAGDKVSYITKIKADKVPGELIAKPKKPAAKPKGKKGHAWIPGGGIIVLCLAPLALIRKKGA